MLGMILFCVFAAAYAVFYAAFLFGRKKTLAGVGMLLAALMTLSPAAALVWHLFS